jgi:paraquat-inducible protein A
LLVWLKAFLLVGASASFALGISLPLMRFESFYLFSTDASLIEVIASLWVGGDAALALVVAAVSIVFPLAKLLLVAAEEMAGKVHPGEGALARFVPLMSKWSMMDVLLVAIVIFATKTSGLRRHLRSRVSGFMRLPVAVVAISALRAKAVVQKA